MESCRKLFFAILHQWEERSNTPTSSHKEPVSWFLQCEEGGSREEPLQALGRIAPAVVNSCQRAEPVTSCLKHFCPTLPFLPAAAVLPLCPQAGRDELLIAKGKAPGTEKMGSLGHPGCCQLGTQTGCRHTTHLGPSSWEGNLSIRVPLLPVTKQSPSSAAGRGGGAAHLKQM